MKAGRHILTKAGAIAGTFLATTMTAQAGLVEDLLGKPDFSFTYSGFLRNEMAVSITGKENIWNQRGNPFNDRTVQRTGQAIDPATGQPVGTAFNDTVERPVPSSDTNINLEYLRGEVKWKVDLFDNLAFRGQLRAVGTLDSVYDDRFDPGDTRAADPAGPLQQEPNYFENRFDSRRSVFPSNDATANSGGRGGEPFNSDPGREASEVSTLQDDHGTSPLEFAGDEYMIDFPQAYFDYQKGRLMVRVGNQQIAWGDMLFFRVLDKPNGIDLRRHSVLDFAPEEFSDKRIPSLGVRAIYLLPGSVPVFGGWEVDAYAQRFRPTIFPNPNTPYNAIASQFTVHDEFKQYDDEYNYGFRLRGPVGPVDITLMVNRRYNHAGVFQWTDTDVQQGLQPCSSPAGNDDLCAAGFEGANAGPLADSAFEPDPTGVVSAEEYVFFGAASRLNHFAATNAAITQFPGARAAGAAPAEDAAAQERQEDFFFQAAGGLRGHITRDYRRETNYGVGFSYKFRGPSDSLLFDQIDMDLEIAYTPDRKYTPLDLHPFRLKEDDELEVGLALQKFVRWSPTFPSAFAILQYQHRSESDPNNRHLSGFGADPNADDPNDRLPTGRSSYNALALGLQQPSPSLVWRMDLSVLYDLQGGLFVQPGLRWKPNSAWMVQVFANLVGTVSGNPNDNALSTVDYADEITTRIQYQF